MSNGPEQSMKAELVMPSHDLVADISFFENLGFRLDQIYPSEDPAVGRMSGHGMLIRLERGVNHPAPILNLLTNDNHATELEAPNGCIVRFKRADYSLTKPATVHKFELRQLRDGAPWVIGRAGMHYRDLIPDRLGGSIIASHIRIPDAGPVPDVVHYHTIGFQLIYCYKGWVRLVYEDQGPPFVLHAGDCVTQPPQIRHRVLEASENLEVIEIGVPADHMTTIDHEMELPNDLFRPEREFDGQIFCHHQLKEASWEPLSDLSFECRNTGVDLATKGVADVRVLRSTGADAGEMREHQADIFFCFVLDGKGALTLNNDRHELGEGDAFVMPPGQSFAMGSLGGKMELLQVSLY